MSDYCVVAAEGTRARFFTLQPADVPEMQSGPNLVEHESLVNPQHRAHKQQIYADTRGGRNRTPGGRGHGYDEHRQQHDAEREHRFARQIADHLEDITRSSSTRNVILCAEKRMLGFLRGALNSHRPNGVQVTEVPKDLAKMTARDLHELLAGEGHLPPRRTHSNAG